MVGYRNDRAYVAKRNALRRQVAKNGTPCHLCGQPIDTTLEWRHPMSFTADHIDAIAAGGRMTGDLLPAHRACNSRRGTKPLEGHVPPIQPKTSRRW